MTTQEKVNAVNDYIAQTTGSSEWHRHWGGLIYTDGPKVVAESCGAWWLIDLIASWQPEIMKKHGSMARFQVWQLTKETEKDTNVQYWMAHCWSDTPFESSILAHQRIEYSDFPDGLLPFNMWVESGTLILPAEH